MNIVLGGGVSRAAVSEMESGGRRSSRGRLRQQEDVLAAHVAELKADLSGCKDARAAALLARSATHTHTQNSHGLCIYCGIFSCVRSALWVVSSQQRSTLETDTEAFKLSYEYVYTLSVAYYSH